MRPKNKLYVVTAVEGEKVHTIRVLAADLQSAVQKVEKQFIQQGPQAPHGECIRAEFGGDVHILD
jgi:hypothetical protein